MADGGRVRSGLRGQTVLAFAVGFLLLWLVLYPNLFVAADSVLDGGRVTADHWARFIRSGSERTKRSVTRTAPSGSE